MERLPQTLLAPDLQMTGLMCCNGYAARSTALMERFVPMFLNGMKAMKTNGRRQKYSCLA